MMVSGRESLEYIEGILQAVCSFDCLTQQSQSTEGSSVHWLTMEIRKVIHWTHPFDPPSHSSDLTKILYNLENRNKDSERRATG